MHRRGPPSNSLFIFDQCYGMLARMGGKKGLLEDILSGLSMAASHTVLACPPAAMLSMTLSLETD